MGRGNDDGERRGANQGRALSSGAPPRSPAALAVAVLVLIAFVLYASVAQLVETPRVHPDESIYGEGAWSLAEGDGIGLRG